MKILFIGGTGTISGVVSSLLLSQGHELYLLNRGNKQLPEGAVSLTADVHNEQEVAGLIKGMKFDVVADFIAFSVEHLERDYRLFKGKTQQFIFISTASAYQKPPANYLITESTPLVNPYWEYSSKKIACEDYLIHLYRSGNFPITIIRPSHTYSERSVPVGLHGKNGSWQVLKRMLTGKPVIIHGDGTSLWTMTHSRDFAKGFVGLLGNAHAIGEAVHITSDESLTWNQIYNNIAVALNVPLKSVHVSSEFLMATSPTDLSGLIGDKSNSVVFDNTKLKRLVPGFNATIRHDQGVKEAVNYMLSHKETQIEDEEFDTWCDKVIEYVTPPIRF